MNLPYFTARIKDKYWRLRSDGRCFVAKDLAPTENAIIVQFDDGFWGAIPCEDFYAYREPITALEFGETGRGRRLDEETVRGLRAEIAQLKKEDIAEKPTIDGNPIFLASLATAIAKHHRSCALRHNGLACTCA